MKRRRCIAALVLIQGLTHTAAASTLDAIAFEFHGNQYHYRFSAHLAAPAAAVRAVVSEVSSLARTNDSIRVSRVLARHADGSWIRQLGLRQCVLVFCFDINFVERVSERANGDIHTAVIPGAGNFRSGETVWQIIALPDGSTQMVMEADQEPDFWIPPVLGPLILKHTFTSEVQETLMKIEQLANARIVR